MSEKREIPDEITTLGQAIRFFREERGMTLRGLARAVGLSAPFVSDVEHDRRTPKLDLFAKALGVRVEQLENYRLTDDLKDWLGQNPKFIQLLRQIRSSNASAEQLQSALQKSTRKR